MLIKSFVIIAFIMIVVSLGSALFHLVKGKNEENSAKTAKALTWRIGLSLSLFIVLILIFAAGLLKPQGIGARMQQVQQQTNPQ